MKSKEKNVDMSIAGSFNLLIRVHPKITTEGRWSVLSLTRICQWQKPLKEFKFFHLRSCIHRNPSGYVMWFMHTKSVRVLTLNMPQFRINFSCGISINAERALLSQVKSTTKGKLFLMQTLSQ